MKAQVFRGVNRLSYEDIPVPTAKIKALTNGMGVDTTILAVPSDKAFFQALVHPQRWQNLVFC